ncbi:hypothetical protein [Desulfosarcina cetonica]|uniref:hypothetical protein n=1 Tax=Desulfosarcina cetonica TaxID=90730 RepID=UPI0006D10CE0|nr:hypothetical protein [Desulfosarcina cetonica]
MGPVLIVAAFVFGTLSSRIGLPPLVGYLVAGFFSTIWVLKPEINWEPSPTPVSLCCSLPSG